MSDEYDYVNAPPSDLIIEGIPFTPMHEKPHDTVSFTHSEMDNDFLNSLLNLDVCVEHDTSKPIGSVIHAKYNELKQPEVMMHIRGDEDHQVTAKHLLPSRLYKNPQTGKRFLDDLSLGHDVEFTPDENGYANTVKRKIPYEISLVQKGDNFYSPIVDYHTVPYSMDAEEYIQEVLLRKKYY